MQKTKLGIEDEMTFFPPVNECPVLYKDGVYDILLDEEIKSPSYYRNAFQTLRNAQEGETVRIIISTYGGNLTSAITFKNLIEQCAAEVVGVLEGEAFSAGSLILLSCPVIHIQPHTTMMCHSAAFGSSGMVQQVRDHVDFTGRHAEAVMEDVYCDFLSAQEFSDLKRGVEIWLDYNQINERLEKMFEAREARFMEEMEGYEPPPTIEDMMLNAAKKALVEHEAEKAKKEAKARKAAEKKKPTLKLEKALEQAKEIQEGFKELEERVNEKA